MGKNTLTALLTDLRALILKSRPAYRDFLGEVTETKTTKILEDVVLTEDGETLPSADPTFTGFVAGKTYRAVVNGDETHIIAVAGSKDGEVIVSYGDNNNYWSVSTYVGGATLHPDADGTYVGATISVYYDETVTTQRWSVKKLAYKLLPDRLLSALSAAANTAHNALTAASFAQSTANAAQSTADAAQSTANAAQSTAKTAVKPSKSDEDNCYYTMYNPYADFKSTRVVIGTSGGSALGIEVNKESYPSVTFVPPVYQTRQADFEFGRAGSGYPHPRITGIGGIVVYSSTPKSTKKFKITVDDTGTLSTTEVTDTTT